MSINSINESFNLVTRKLLRESNEDFYADSDLSGDYSRVRRELDMMDDSRSGLACSGGGCCDLDDETFEEFVERVALEIQRKVDSSFYNGASVSNNDIVDVIREQFEFFFPDENVYECLNMEMIENEADSRADEGELEDLLRRAAGKD